MGPSTSHDLRCPVCQAHVRADADWCTLCFTDLRPVPAPVPTSEPADQPVGEPADGAATGTDVPLGGGSGKHARSGEADPAGAGGGPDPVGLEGVDVAAMLAQLAIESDSGLGPLAGRLESRGAKAIVITGGIAVVCLVLFLLMAVLGALL